MLEVAGDMDVSVVEELRSEAEERRLVLVARFDASSPVRAGDNVEVAFDPGKLHFFNVESGPTIYD